MYQGGKNFGLLKVPAREHVRPRGARGDRKTGPGTGKKIRNVIREGNAERLRVDGEEGRKKVKSSLRNVKKKGNLKREKKNSQGTSIGVR
jgi:hypothetical protein